MPFGPTLLTWSACAGGQTKKTCRRPSYWPRRSSEFRSFSIQMVNFHDAHTRILSHTLKSERLSHAGDSSSTIFFRPVKTLWHPVNPPPPKKIVLILAVPPLLNRLIPVVRIYGGIRCADQPPAVPHPSLQTAFVPLHACPSL